MISKKNIKMSDFLYQDHRLLAVLYRLGIGLGFGEKTVDETCRAAEVNTDTFLLIANVYSLENYIPSQELLHAANVLDIVKYLHISHSYYLDIEFAELEKNLTELIKPCNSAQKAVISKFFADYKAEVQHHFSYEEDIVFPYIYAIVKGEKVEGYSIETFEENHDNIEEKMDDLRNIIMKYLPSECDTVTAIRILSHLSSLEEDLDKHTYIENSILIPLINEMEKAIDE